jgi:hypothetical protein
MQLGRHLRELWQMRLGLAIALFVALLASLWSVGKIELFPPGLKARALETAAAQTRALVDTPKSSVLSLSENTYNFQAITNRALLVGNVMASEPVRQYIARRAHVPAAVIQVTSPVTPDFPRPLATDRKAHTSDILKSPDQYRLSIQVNPTVPEVDVYAQAPTAAMAQQLANGAVDGMGDYLRDVGKQQGVAPSDQVHLEQLGRAKGQVLDKGVSLKLGILSFLLMFAAASATVLFVARVRRGWILEATQDSADPWLAGPQLQEDG